MITDIDFHSESVSMGKRASELTSSFIELLQKGFANLKDSLVSAKSAQTQIDVLVKKLELMINEFETQNVKYNDIECFKSSRFALEEAECDLLSREAISNLELSQQYFLRKPRKDDIIEIVNAYSECASLPRSNSMSNQPVPSIISANNDLEKASIAHASISPMDSEKDLISTFQSSSIISPRVNSFSPQVNSFSPQVNSLSPQVRNQTSESRSNNSSEMDTNSHSNSIKENIFLNASTKTGMNFLQQIHNQEKAIPLPSQTERTGSEFSRKSKPLIRLKHALSPSPSSPSPSSHHSENNDMNFITAAKQIFSDGNILSFNSNLNSNLDREKNLLQNFSTQRFFPSSGEKNLGSFQILKEGNFEKSDVSFVSQSYATKSSEDLFLDENVKILNSSPFLENASSRPRIETNAEEKFSEKNLNRFLPNSASKASKMEKFAVENFSENNFNRFLPNSASEASKMEEIAVENFSENNFNRFLPNSASEASKMEKIAVENFSENNFNNFLPESFSVKSSETNTSVVEMSIDMNKKMNVNRNKKMNMIMDANMNTNMDMNGNGNENYFQNVLKTLSDEKVNSDEIKFLTLLKAGEIDSLIKSEIANQIANQMQNHNQDESQHYDQSNTNQSQSQSLSQLLNDNSNFSQHSKSQSQSQDDQIMHHFSQNELHHYPKSNMKSQFCDFNIPTSHPSVHFKEKDSNNQDLDSNQRYELIQNQVQLQHQKSQSQSQICNQSPSLPSSSNEFIDDNEFVSKLKEYLEFFNNKSNNNELLSQYERKLFFSKYFAERGIHIEKIDSGVLSKYLNAIQKIRNNQKEEGKDAVDHHHPHDPSHQNQNQSQNQNSETILTANYLNHMLENLPNDGQILTVNHQNMSNGQDITVESEMQRQNQKQKQTQKQNQIKMFLEDSDDNKEVKRNRSFKRLRNGRKVVITHTLDDGWNWRKYGQKETLNNKHPRSYYRCKEKCGAKRQVEKCNENPSLLRVIYEGDHNHPPPIIRPSNFAIHSTPATNPFLFSSPTSPSLPLTSLVSNMSSIMDNQNSNQKQNQISSPLLPLPLPSLLSSPPPHPPNFDANESSMTNESNDLNKILHTLSQLHPSLHDSSIFHSKQVETGEKDDAIISDTLAHVSPHVSSQSQTQLAKSPETLNHDQRVIRSESIKFDLFSRSMQESQPNSTMSDSMPPGKTSTFDSLLNRLHPHPPLPQTVLPHHLSLPILLPHQQEMNDCDADVDCANPMDENDRERKRKRSGEIEFKDIFSPLSHIDDDHKDNDDINNGNKDGDDDNNLNEEERKGKKEEEDNVEENERESEKGGNGEKGEKGEEENKLKGEEELISSSNIFTNEQKLQLYHLLTQHGSMKINENKLNSPFQYEFMESDAAVKVGQLDADSADRKGVEEVERRRIEKKVANVDDGDMDMDVDVDVNVNDAHEQYENGQGRRLNVDKEEDMGDFRSMKKLDERILMREEDKKEGRNDGRVTDDKDDERDERSDRKESEEEEGGVRGEERGKEEEEEEECPSIIAIRRPFHLVPEAMDDKFSPTYMGCLNSPLMQLSPFQSKFGNLS